MASSPAYYRPFATRVPVLIILHLVTLTLISITEYACRGIYAHEGAGSISTALNGLGLKVRGEEEQGPTSNPSVSSTTSGSVTRSATAALSTGDGPGFQSPIVSTTSITRSTNVVASTSFALSTGDGSGFQSPIVPTTACASIALSTGDGSGFQSPIVSTTSTIVTVYSSESTVTNFVTGMTTPYVPYESQVIRTMTSVQSDGNAITFESTISITTWLPQPSLVVSMVTSVKTNKATATSFMTMEVSPEITTYLATSSVTGVCAGSSTDICVVIVTEAKVTTKWNAMTSTAPPSKASELPTPISTTVNSTGTYLTLNNGTVVAPHQITNREYVIVAWIPLILAAIYSILWRIVDSTIREMEPFFQLQRSGGTLADHSLCLDYAYSWIITLPFKAIHRRHFRVLCSSVISITLLVVAPLSAEAFFVSLSGQCDYSKGTICHATWGIYPLLAHTISAMLGLIAVLTIILIAFHFRYQSGVFANPLSIGGLAPLVQNQALLCDFRGLNSMASNSELRSELAGRRYKLGWYTDIDGKSCYGIIPINYYLDNDRATRPDAAVKLLTDDENSSEGSINAQSATSGLDGSPREETMVPGDHEDTSSITRVNGNSGTYPALVTTEDPEPLGHEAPRQLRMSQSNQNRTYHPVATQDPDENSTPLAGREVLLPDREFYSNNNGTNTAINSSNPTEESTNPPEGDKVEGNSPRPQTSIIEKVTRDDKLVKRIIYIIALVVLGFLLGMIIYYQHTTGKSGFESFMDQGFGVRAMMTIVGLAVSLFWAQVDEDFRKLEPYRHLIRGSAPPDNSILFPVWVSPYSAVLPALYHQYFLVALFSFVAILCDFLPMLLANIPSSMVVTKVAQNTCHWITTVILTLMIICVLILLFRKQINLKCLPRKPETVASVLRYIADSDQENEMSLLGRFRGLALKKGAERDKEIREMEGRYTLGRRENGRLCIDERAFIKRRLE